MITVLSAFVSPGSKLSETILCLSSSDRRRRRTLPSSGSDIHRYLSASGPLMPMGADPDLLKADPRAEIAIDGHVFPMNLMFAEDFVVLEDATDHRVPILSERLLDALESGRTMVLRFDLLAERADQPAAFDGEATINLQGGSAIVAVRRCASPDEHRISQEMEAARTAAASVDHLAGAHKDR